MNVEDIRRKNKNNLANRKCTPMPTNQQCTYNGRAVLETLEDASKIVNGQETRKNAYPFMVRFTNIDPKIGDIRFF